MSTYTIPGAMTHNNLGISSIVQSDPSTEVRTHKGVPAMAKVYMEDIELVSEAQDGQLFNEVVAIMRTRVTELVSASFPGLSDGDSCVIKFNPGSVVEHVSDDDFESTESEVEDLPTINDAAPSYEMHYHFTREQLFTIAAKGGFVPGYADYAIPSNILHREWQSIPVLMDVTEVRCAGICPRCGQVVPASEPKCPNCGGVPNFVSVYFFELENAGCAEVNMHTIGYNLPEYFLVSEEMRLNPDRVVGLEAESNFERPDYVSREEALQDALAELDEDIEGLDYEGEIDEPAVDEAELSGGSLDELGNRRDPRETAYADDMARQQELDNIAIAAILNGGSAIEAVEHAQQSASRPRQEFVEPAAEPAAEPVQERETPAERRAEDSHASGDDELDLGDFESQVARSADGAGLEADDGLDFDERGLSEGERNSRRNLKAVGREAVGDMLIDGASSISDAQTNANSFGDDELMQF